MTDEKKLIDAMTELRVATVSFHETKSALDFATAAHAEAQQRLYKARCEADMLTRIDDNSAIPGAFMGKPKVDA